MTAIAVATENNNGNETENAAQRTVMVKSTPIDPNLPIVRGYDFNLGRDVDALLTSSFLTTGFQATSFGQAVSTINEMVCF
jgi:deoxyhypusine synthase